MSSHAERNCRLRVSLDGRYTKTGAADEKVPYFYIGPVPSPIDLEYQSVCEIFGAALIPVAHIMHTRLSCGVAEC